MGGAAFVAAALLAALGLLDFMNALHREGIPVADIDIMAKTNPALVPGLTPPN